ncbi:ornithine cyclodeaminase [Inhella proteolytica]|uniref:Ornithine cyclodeaminase n=1 Tax=Inhella proteolytica TaxID=2795029 RepID=A0A931NJ84_9BURK|nr:ornithine cyclodeaminase [Inhella proteolytica]MBH9578764.1 ornithine cyclodeaminase [Inhella proteolytica]
MRSNRHTASPLSTTFVSVSNMVRLIQRKGLSTCLVGVADRIEQEFLRWEAFDKSARIACHSADGVVELMPIADDQQFSFKYVNGHPKNHRFGLPTVMAFGLLADVETGAPRFLSELTLTTAIRTAAMSALAAKKLARPNSRSMALIGNGAQSEFQALAFRDIVGIRELRLFDVDPAASAKLAANLQGQGLEITLCTSTAEAVKGVDIITTVTADKTNATIITPEMVEPGMHINGVGGDCPGKTELHRGVLEMGAVFCEFEPQSRIEGDMQQMPADFPVTEFWEVLAGRKAGRVSAEQVTVFDSVGFALEDFAALCFMRDAAAEFGIGEQIELVPNNPDPKNLFGLLGSQRAQLKRAA